ncbi:MAG: asparagine synthase C-terminal domain-containing protein, partial [Myxococcota bacterium]
LQKLLPGQYLCFAPEAGTMRVESYWRMRFASSPDVSRVQGASENDLINLLRERVLAAVKARLISDVPLGVLLSGGVDSSLVAAAMTQVGSERVQSFSIAFDDESFDESSHARRVAEHLGTDHHEDRLSPATMLDILPAVAEVMCEPIGDASIIPTYLLSRFTRQTVTVALGGDGGDELFLGYPTFAADRVARAMDAAVPLGVQGWLGRGALQAAGYLPVSRKNFSFDFKVKRFAQGLGFGAAERHQAWMGSFMPQELQDVLQPEVADEALGKSPYALIEDLHAGSDARDGLDEASLQYARLYLTGGVLVKVDRASMAHALEVRAPLLDREVVELATAVPSSLKLKGFTTKYLLKEAARPWLPEGIVDRPKKGFGVPIADWLRGPLKPLTRELLAPDRLRRAGWFRPEAVTALLNAHEAGTADHRKPLWTLLAFELWRDRHGVEAGA